MPDSTTTPTLVRPAVLTSPASAGDRLRALGAPGATVALVPTMGALHAGHLRLVAAARANADLVVVSVFVNPLQFGPAEDYERYPRTLAADVEKLQEAGADAVFAPAPEDMYPKGVNQVVIEPGPIGHILEGRTRPALFSGALTVVAKLFGIIRPDVAVFGQKDAQQLFLIRAMVEQLNIPTRIFGVPTVRDRDGLALSSRNRYLRQDERTSALALPRALHAARGAAGQPVDAVLSAARRVLDAAPAVKPDYAVVVDEASFQPVGADFTGAGRLLLAAQIGATRLIDNTSVRIDARGELR